MNTSNRNTENLALVSWTWIDPSKMTAASMTTAVSQPPAQARFDIFAPIRQWLDQVQVQDANLAHRICQLIPAQCPFERDIKLFGYTLLHIPPLCKLNPVYDQVVALRFRAICYLADVCGEDISAYC